MQKGILALTKDGQLTICVASPEERGKRRCNHIDHKKNNETEEDFIKRVESKIIVDSTIDSLNIEKEEKIKTITKEEINDYALKIDEIAGQKVTIDNWEEVISKLPPEKIRQITAIGFKVAPEFSLPISDEDFSEADTENKLYFANLHEYGISGKRTAIEQMFIKIGEVPAENGIIDIKGNYKNGLKPDEYFAKQFSARGAMIAKTVSVSKPGYAIWAKQKLVIMDND